jgi:uncharacterized membrane protein
MAVVLVLNRERHVAAMTSWGVHFARGLKTSLHLVTAKDKTVAFSDEAIDDQDRNISLWRAVEEALLAVGLAANRTTADDATTSNIAVIMRQAAEETRLQAMLNYMAEANPGLLLMGKQESGNSDQVSAKVLARQLFERAPSPTMLLRLGSQDGAQCQSIVVPTTKGKHVWMALKLDREQRAAVCKRLQIGSLLSQDFMVLIPLSTAIAAFGLVLNSTTVVIGAMLVAPLMTPLLGAGLALVQGNLPMLRSCFYSIVISYLLAVTIGVFTGLASSPFAGMTAELVDCGGPTLFDFGVALVSGIAASYCLAQPGLFSALAGVALSFQCPDIAAGAALLFATNVVTIILGAALIFFIIGIRGAKKEKVSRWVRGVTMALLLAVVGLTIPLSRAMFSKVVQRPLSRAQEEAVQGMHPQAQVTAIAIGMDTRSNELIIEVETPESLDSNQATRLATVATEHYDKPTMVRFREQRIMVGKSKTKKGQNAK